MKVPLKDFLQKKNEEKELAETNLLQPDEQK
jgi:hypothetical protein